MTVLVFYHFPIYILPLMQINSSLYHYQYYNETAVENKICGLLVKTAG